MAKKNEQDAGQAEVQSARDEAREKGYEGVTPDETPNEEYTVAGVTKGAKGGVTSSGSTR